MPRNYERSKSSTARESGSACGGSGAGGGRCSDVLDLAASRLGIFLLTTLVLGAHGVLTRRNEARRGGRGRGSGSSASLSSFLERRSWAIFTQVRYGVRRYWTRLYHALSQPSLLLRSVRALHRSTRTTSPKPKVGRRSLPFGLAGSAEAAKSLSILLLYVFYRKVLGGKSFITGVELGASENWISADGSSAEGQYWRSEELRGITACHPQVQSKSP